jgi:hypothetical protein
MHCRYPTTRSHRPRIGWPISLLAVLLSAACDRVRLDAVTTEPLGGAGAGQQGADCSAGRNCSGDAAACMLDDSPCALHAECCSGLCALAGTQQRHCVTSHLCVPARQSCTSGTQCCSTVCGTDGLCAPLAGTCKIVGESCTTSAECCSQRCADPGTGNPVCQRLSGCLPIDEMCQAITDCCSGVCPIDGTGVGRCQRAAGSGSAGCQSVGELCGFGTFGSCCGTGGPGNGGMQACIATTVGVPRCSGSSGACLAAGSICHYGDECCSTVCVPNLDGNLTCAMACGADGAACKADLDCCTGICVLGQCQESPFGCTVLGAKCSVTSDCCSGLCDTSGRCTAS